MSGTFVASATRASEKIAYFLTAQNAAQNVTFSTITAQSGTFSNISTQNIEITSGKIGTGGGRFISTIGNELYYWDGSQLEQLTSVSSISSLGEWSLEPAISDVNIDGNNIYNVNTLECGNVSSLMGEFQSLYAKDFTAETVTVLSTIQTINYISTLELRANSGLFNTISSGNAYVGNLSGNVANFNTISSGSINVPGFNTSSITVQNLSSITGYIQALQVSSINGSEFTSNTVTVSSINTSQIIAQNVSSVTATLAQAFLSTVSFNPSFSGNLGPNISVDMGMGDFVGSVLGGLIGVGVTVPAGIFAIIGGLVSLIAPRPINNINSNVYEQINMTTQLQVSTLGQQFSTIFRGLSSTVSTIAGNPETVNFEVFTSTISSPPPVVAMRSVGDPLQLVSTPWTEYQAFSQWVELPSGSVGSNLNLSTLTLLQSTILRSDPGPGGILQVLEAQNPNSYGQVEAQAYSMGATLTGSNGILYYQDINDRPGFLDDAGGAHTLAYTSDIPGAENLAVTLSNGNSAGGCNINMNSNSITTVNSIGATPVGAFGGAVTGFRTYTIANPTDNDFATVTYNVTDTARFPSTINANRGMLFHNEPDTITDGYIGYDRVEMNDGLSIGLSRMTFSNVEVSYGPPGLNRTMRMFAGQGTGDGYVEARANLSTSTLLTDVYARLDVNNSLDPNVTLYSDESGSQIANPGILQVQLDKRTLTHSDARVSPSSFLISTNTSVEIRPKVSIIQTSAGGTADGLLFLNNTSATAGAVSAQLYKQRNVAQNETVSEVLFYANDAVGDKTQFGAIKCVATNVTSGNEDGAIDIFTSVNGVSSLVMRFNGADNENNSFRPLDMNGNAIRTSGGSLLIDTASSSGSGDIAITSKGATSLFSGGALTLTASTGGIYLSTSVGNINCLKTLDMNSQTVSNAFRYGVTGGFGTNGQTLISQGASGSYYSFTLPCVLTGTNTTPVALNSSTWREVLGNPTKIYNTLSSPSGSYLITFTIYIDDINDDLFFYPEVNTGTGGNIGGQTFIQANPFGVKTLSLGGVYSGSFTFSDVFIIGGDEPEIYFLYCQTGSGSHTTNIVKFNISAMPITS
jgi:hypothetical protein